MHLDTRQTIGALGAETKSDGFVAGAGGRDGIGRYRPADGLDLFGTASAQTGRDDHQETISTGVRLRF